MAIGVHAWAPLPLAIRGPATVFLGILSALVAMALAMATPVAARLQTMTKKRFSATFTAPATDR